MDTCKARISNRESISSECGSLTKLSPRLATQPIFITHRRWDPLTAGSSALIGTAANMLKFAVGIVRAPYDEIQASAKQEKEMAKKQDMIVLDQDSGASRTTNTTTPASAAFRAIGASARSIGMFNASLFKGTMIDMPLAITEGLRAVPKLYGEDVQNHGVVDGWMSGGVVAGKVCISEVK